jgi:hypothetical protein
MFCSIFCFAKGKVSKNELPYAFLIRIFKKIRRSKNIAIQYHAITRSDIVDPKRNCSA